MKKNSFPFELTIQHDLRPADNLDFLEVMPGDYREGSLKVSYSKFTSTLVKAVENRVSQTWERIGRLEKYFPISKIMIKVSTGLRFKGGYILTSKKAKSGLELKILLSDRVVRDILGSHSHPVYQEHPESLYYLDELLTRAMGGEHGHQLKYPGDTYIPVEMMLYHLQSYREDGIQHLGAFMRGQGFYRHFPMVKTLVGEMIHRLRNTDFREGTVWLSVFAYSVQDEYFVHDFAPLMLLHVIYCKAMETNDVTLKGLVKKGIREQLEDDEICLLIKEGLSIPYLDYLVYLTRPGFENEPFVEAKILLDMFLSREGEDATEEVKKRNPKDYLKPEDPKRYQKIRDTYRDFYAALKTKLTNSTTVSEW